MAPALCKALSEMCPGASVSQPQTASCCMPIDDAVRRTAGVPAIMLLLLCACGCSGGNRNAGPDAAFTRENYTKHEYRIAMRDGAKLFTSVYVPKDASPTNRYPIVLQRTLFSVAPYGEEKYPGTLGPDRFMLHEKYIFVYQEAEGLVDRIHAAFLADKEPQDGTRGTSGTRRK